MSVFISQHFTDPTWDLKWKNDGTRRESLCCSETTSANGGYKQASKKPLLKLRGSIVTKGERAGCFWEVGWGREDIIFPNQSINFETTMHFVDYWFHTRTKYKVLKLQMHPPGKACRSIGTAVSAGSGEGLTAGSSQAGQLALWGDRRPSAASGAPSSRSRNAAGSQEKGEQRITSWSP